jgi:hypothetical protein
VPPSAGHPSDVMGRSCGLTKSCLSSTRRHIFAR